MKKLYFILLFTFFRSLIFGQINVFENAKYAGGEDALNKYLEKNLIYPAKAKKDSIEGSFSVNVDIAQNGKAVFHDFAWQMTNCEECKAEALRLIKKMPKWIPAKINGSPVEGGYASIEIVFELKKGNVAIYHPGRQISVEGEEEIVIPDPNAIKDVLEYNAIDKQPIFQGGDAKMMEFVKKNVRYPKEEYDNGISGTCFITFVIDKMGEVKDIKLLRGISGGLQYNSEALRVVKMMPNWTAGEKNGQKVNVRYNLPIKFARKV